MPLKIAHINLAKGLRGGENQTLAIIEGLTCFDVEQTLVCRKNSPLEQQATKLNIFVIAIQKPFLLNVKKLKSFDLFHVHEGRSIYFALAAHFLFQKPYLVTRRVLNKPHEKWLTKLAYKKAALIVSISKKIDAVMREFCPTQQFKMIPDIARRLECNSQEVANLKVPFEGKLIIGHVGALDDSIKNQSLILKAANQLREHENIVFMLLGVGKDEAQLKNLVTELNLKNVMFEGFKTNIADYFALFDIFVYPSKEEGLGSAILEAFHFKKPVIAANVGGIPDILGDNDYGLLINPFDTDELSNAIMKLYQNVALRNHYAEAGFKRKDAFSSDKICRDYHQLYQQILNIHA
ncbi:MAG: glycosyltransferase family 4 protein [Methylococcales bacterium]|nr:glycosyltransferase family 4 protein [Methylococcales bacterium]